MTIKGERAGIARPEFEYEIPIDDAEEMLKTLCLRPLVEKIRYRVPHAGLTWEVDVFAGQAEGLILTEVELECVDQSIEVPRWVGEEVTNDLRYRNARIAIDSPPQRSG